MAHIKYIKVNAGEISPEDLRVMMTSQSKLTALADKVVEARSRKVELNDQSFREFFLTQVKDIIQ